MIGGALIYKNKNYRRIRRSHILIISCGKCKKDILKYQKVGRGNVLRLYFERIVEGSIDFSKNLICPECNNELGQKVTVKDTNKVFYRMRRSHFNTRELEG